MAEAPNAKAFGSWEDAFKYPVAAVRGMERQLRSDIESNRERLRSLVGASYRDLLGTAETIIQMDGQMQNVESYLGDMGSKCNTRLLEKMASNMRSWDTRLGAEDKHRYALASQLAVLRACPGVISRLLKSTTSLLLAAKVLVMSRLLHTKISQRSSPPPYLESLRNRLATLRRRLLAKIDRSMKKIDQSRETLVEAMCAFALATSSSPTDGLRHYHHVRLEAIHEQGRETAHDVNMLQALRIYVNTLKDTRAAVPGNLAQALERLKSAPILRSPELYALMGLNLDLHERNLGDDIRMFTPYIRLDDLQKAESEKLLKQWATQAFSSFLDNLRAKTNDIHDVHQLMNLRTKTLELWFSNQQHAVGIESSEIVDGLRDVFNSQCSTIIHKQALSLDAVISAVQATLQGWQSGVSDANPLLWAPSMLSMETSNGAKAFREALISRSQGRNEPVQLVAERYAGWARGIEGIENTIQKMSEIKWEDDINAIDDDDDNLNNNQALLSEDDPRELREELSESLQNGFYQLQEAMQKATDDLNNEEHGQKAVFLLRVWRNIRQHLPTSYHNPALGLDSVMALQQLVAKTVCHVPLERGTKRMAKAYQSSRVVGKALWEGDPPLPVLPSPWVFRLLRELSSAMVDIGIDIWSSQSIMVLKEHLRASLASLLEGLVRRPEQLNGHSDTRNDAEKGEQPIGNEDREGFEGSESTGHANGTLSDGEVPTPSHSGLSQEVQVQRLFDLLYIANTTKMKEKEDEAEVLVALQASAEEDLGLPIESNKGLKKGADEYWKRTSLLFALLA